MIRVLVVDDQQLVRSGIISLLGLSDKVCVTGEAANGKEALERLAAETYDVVLMDIQMPLMNGIETLDQLYQQRNQTPVIMLTTFDDQEQVRQAVANGAKGYLLKDTSLEQLVDAIEQVVSGAMLIQPAATAQVKQRLNQTHTDFDSLPDASNLSAKETEVLRLMSAGYSNQEIAETLFRSTGTIKNQVSAILSKLGVRDRTRAVLRAIELGLI